MISLTADKVIVRGPKVDGSYAVTFEVGEYEQGKIADLVMLPHDSVINVKVDASS